MTVRIMSSHSEKSHVSVLNCVSTPISVSEGKKATPIDLTLLKQYSGWGKKMII